MNNVIVVDYGMCNIDSIVRAVQYCGGSVMASNRVSDIESSSHLILPGVGSFDKAYKVLDETGLAKAIRSQVLDFDIPILGICLGMQLLASTGEEGDGSPGLDLIPGNVAKIEINGNHKLPHVGWNDISIENASALFEGIDSGTDFYFVHSYSFRCEHGGHVTATVEYSNTLTAAVGNKNIFGVQFHPEKSQKPGAQLLKNFIRL